MASDLLGHGENDVCVSDFVGPCALCRVVCCLLMSLLQLLRRLLCCGSAARACSSFLRRGRNGHLQKESS